jgi:hypothetical protein
VATPQVRQELLGGPEHGYTCTVITKTAVVVERIRELSCRDEDYAELLREVHKLAALSPRSIGAILPAGTKFYRGTNHHHSVPSRIEEIWFPPEQCVKTFGRANRPGSPMFYCSSDPNGAFREVETKLGDYAVLATWEAIQPVILHEVGYTPEVLARAGSSRLLAHRHVEFNAELSDDAREAREFLSLAFTDPTPANYRATAAIAEMLLACDDLAGIAYPAVAKWANVDNLALQPQFVRTRLKLTEAAVAYIDDVTADGIGGAAVARLTSSSNGDLLWEYPGTEIAIQPHSSFTLHIKPGERKRVTIAGQFQINGQTFDLLPGYSFELRSTTVVICDLQGKVVATGA